MNYVYRRRYSATPMERFRMNLKYSFRRNFKPAMEWIGEAIGGILWFAIVFFFFPVFVAIFH